MDRRSVRLKGFDYSAPGAYFVTIVTQGRASLFGAVVNGEMRHSPAGEMTWATWRSLPNRFAGMEIGDAVLMPNHFHGIIILHGTVGAGLVPARSLPDSRSRAATLGDIVGAFKSLVTRACMRGVREAGWPAFQGHLWQRNYYEHIIRDNADCPCATWRKDVRWSAVPPSREDQKRRYIDANPMRWDEDDENPTHRLVTSG